VVGLVLLATGDTISISDLLAELTSFRSAPVAHAGVMNLVAEARVGLR
jgi:hypothetical protein